jgi:hypothetical protein
MRRSRSGQVLVAAATLMLAVLLVSAMSIPVINTDIEPSSAIYNKVGQIVFKHVADIITIMSAYQCAKAVVYSDGKERIASYSNDPILKQELDKQLKKLKQEITKLNVQDVKITMDEAQINAISTDWNGNPKSPKAGRVTAIMDIKLTIEFKGGGRIYKYKYEERLAIDTLGSGTFKANPVQGLGAIQTAVGFIPIVGAFTDNIEGVEFSLSLYIKEYSVYGYGTDNYKKNLGPKEREDLDEMVYQFEKSNMVVDMLKPRKVVSQGGGKSEMGPKFVNIRWEEYMKVDWSGIVVGLLLDAVEPLKLVGKGFKVITKSLKAISYTDTGLSDNSAREVEIVSPKLDILGTGKIGKEFWDSFNKYFNQRRKVEPIKESQPGAKTNLNQGRNEKGGSYGGGGGGGGGGPGDIIDEATNRVSDVFRKGLYPEYRIDAVNIQSDLINQWIKVLTESGQSGVDWTSGKYHLLAENIASAEKRPAYIVDNDPLLLIGLSLHNGNALFTSCVWLNGAWYAP